jgi:hypothetical protein
MNFHRPGVPVLSLAAIARSILDPPEPAPKPRTEEPEAIEALRRVYPLLFRTLQVAYAKGMLSDEDVDDIRTSVHEVMEAFADIANRRRKLGEAYDIRREDTIRLKNKATNGLAAFNEHLSEIAELASRLRDAGWLEEGEYLAMLDLHELARRIHREIVVWAS